MGRTVLDPRGRERQWNPRRGLSTGPRGYIDSLGLHQDIWLPWKEFGLADSQTEG